MKTRSCNLTPPSCQLIPARSYSETTLTGDSLCSTLCPPPPLADPPLPTKNAAPDMDRPDCLSGWSTASGVLPCSLLILSGTLPTATAEAGLTLCPRGAREEPPRAALAPTAARASFFTLSKFAASCSLRVVSGGCIVRRINLRPPLLSTTPPMPSPRLPNTLLSPQWPGNRRAAAASRSAVIDSSTCAPVGPVATRIASRPSPVSGPFISFVSADPRQSGGTACCSSDTSCRTHWFSANIGGVEPAPSPAPPAMSTTRTQADRVTHVSRPAAPPRLSAGVRYGFTATSIVSVCSQISVVHASCSVWPPCWCAAACVGYPPALVSAPAHTRRLLPSSR
mmetsp:Transcript_46724/g.74750  ORF Transcript_46724/g.74750 Transcript_46724/m.74750 type:complete len:338 (+) Transcript_46724:1302-2315(+)